ncbi:MAG: hypothetical protein HQL14_02460 [Candidatus Omnitrophica bacterium]|nr:hypothetical protein [Candidatus Omnitrophota bacterium]
MKKVFVMFLFGSFLLAGVSFAQAPTAATPAPSTPTHAAAAHHERHPEMHAALRKLKGAKSDLEKAAHDYAGHRVKAIAAIDEAIREIKEGLESDKK